LGNWANLLLTVQIQGCTFTGSFRFLALSFSAQIAQLAEHPLGKGEVDGSNPFLGSSIRKHVGSGFCDDKSGVKFITINHTSVSHG
jgi:hypothetical protein